MRDSITRSRVRAHGLPSHDRWLLSYADFVTLLLAVFIVLFASLRHNGRSIRSMSTAIHSGFEDLGVGSAPSHIRMSAPFVAARKPAQAGRLEPSHLDTDELARQLRAVLEDAISKHEVVVQQTSGGLTVRLQELGFFHSGDAALLPDAADELQRTAQVLMRYNLEVRVEGHSDDKPIHTAAFHSNWELSTARAMSVLSVLVDGAGFPPDKIAVTGYGSYRPIAENVTEAGRQLNRRVDLILLTPRNGDDLQRMNGAATSGGDRGTTW